MAVVGPGQVVRVPQGQPPTTDKLYFLTRLRCAGDPTDSAHEFEPPSAFPDMWDESEIFWADKTDADSRLEAEQRRLQRVRQTVSA